MDILITEKAEGQKFLAGATRLPSSYIVSGGIIECNYYKKDGKIYMEYINESNYSLKEVSLLEEVGETSATDVKLI